MSCIMPRIDISYAISSPSAYQNGLVSSRTQAERLLPYLMLETAILRPSPGVRAEHELLQPGLAQSFPRSGIKYSFLRPHEARMPCSPSATPKQSTVSIVHRSTYATNGSLRCFTVTTNTPTRAPPPHSRQLQLVLGLELAHRQQRGVRTCCPRVKVVSGSEACKSSVCAAFFFHPFFLG
ncbi:uncharacterized protein BJX67DRAFT_365776 [Aspergillus lucknowensis]|uniref:Uncharacterized protein n=1 Tax=Aspergillus lucknowensis TaxID=176173 RepID=A0ABR4LDR7_9EURO